MRQNQKPIIDICLPKILENGGGVISVACAGGKCLAKGTKIMMFNGYIEVVENLQVGDRIMGDDGTPRIIQSLGRGRECMYNVKEVGDSECRADYTVNESHILSLMNDDNKYCGYIFN